MKTVIQEKSSWQLSCKHMAGQICIVVIAIATSISCDTQEEASVAGDDPHALFLTFSTSGQTLPACIHKADRMVNLEVDHDIDVTALKPEFKIPAGYTAWVNGVNQTSGKSTVDFSTPVNYELRDQDNKTTTWEVSAVSLGCRILIDASHDGGVWWFPQYEGTGFDPDQYHQGQDFANVLRSKGFEVTELGRGEELTEEMFFGYYIVIRINGFQAYTSRELLVYTNLLDRGMNLVFITDHKLNDPVDELGDHLGLQFEGAADGTVSRFAEHEITKGIESIEYIGGSVITNADGNPAMEILGWLGDGEYAGEPVMGILHYPNSKIFFIGDTNGIEVQPQPFIDNLITWMGDYCSQW